MASRKETPDVLGELLGGGAPPPEPVVAPEPLSGKESEPVLAEVPAPPPVVEARPVFSEEAMVLRQSEPEAEAGTNVESVRRRKASRRRPSKRTRWEYVEIIFHDHGGFRPRYISGLESRYWKKAPLIYDYLNYLGEQGWELAGTSGRHKDQMRAYLKRPRL